MKNAITNELYYKDLTVTEGESTYGDGPEPLEEVLPADVQLALQTLGDIVTDAIAAGNISGGIWNQPDNEGDSRLVKANAAEISVILLTLLHKISGLAVTSILLLQLRNTSMVTL